MSARTLVAAGTLALLVVLGAYLFMSPAAGPPAQAVSVTVNCNGPHPINIAPPIYRRARAQPSVWVLNIRDPGSTNSIAIEAKPDQDERPWPFIQTSYTSDGNGVLVIPADQFIPDIPVGTYYYQVAYTCDGVRQVLDPRMDLHR